MIKLLLALAVLAGTAHAQLAVREVRLENGLRVVLAPDSHAGVVAVHVRYDVGSADETPAQAGFTHVVERLLYTGSAHVDDFEARIDAAGGWTTSTTTVDHVGIVDDAPAGALELVLWLEAERMASLPLGIDDMRVHSAVAQVGAERHAAYEGDSPGNAIGGKAYALVARAVQQALWQGDPNDHLVLGDAIVERADLLAFIRTYFVPANATLVIAGSFDPAHVTDLVRRYFGWISGGTRALVATRQPGPLSGPGTLQVVDPVPKVVVAFRTNRPYAADTLALEIGAQLLAGGRGSILGRALVRTATDVHAEVVHQARGGEIRIWATAAPGVEPASLVVAIETELENLHQMQVSPMDLDRARRAYELDLITELENMAFRAQRLAEWASYTSTASYLPKLREQIAHLTPDQLRTAVEVWLQPSALVTVIGT